MYQKFGSKKGQNIFWTLGQQNISGPLFFRPNILLDPDWNILTQYVVSRMKGKLESGYAHLNLFCFFLVSNQVSI